MNPLLPTPRDTCGLPIATFSLQALQGSEPAGWPQTPGPPLWSPPLLPWPARRAAANGRHRPRRRHHTALFTRRRRRRRARGGGAAAARSWWAASWRAAARSKCSRRARAGVQGGRPAGCWMRSRACSRKSRPSDPCSTSGPGPAVGAARVMLKLSRAHGGRPGQTLSRPYSLNPSAPLSRSLPGPLPS